MCALLRIERGAAAADRCYGSCGRGSVEKASSMAYAHGGLPRPACRNIPAGVLAQQQIRREVVQPCRVVPPASPARLTRGGRLSPTFTAHRGLALAPLSLVRRVARRLVVLGRVGGECKASACSGPRAGRRLLSPPAAVDL